MFDIIFCGLFNIETMMSIDEYIWAAGALPTGAGVTITARDALCSRDPASIAEVLYNESRDSGLPVPVLCM